MACAHMIIDGYSLVYRDEALAGLARRNLALARHRLVRLAEGLVGRVVDRVTIVFDGIERGRGEGYEGSGVEVLFAPAYLTADGLIERMVASSKDPAALLVVTSDRMERETVSAAGAETLSCGDFMLQYGPDAPRAGRSRAAGGRGTLGDFFPKPDP